jgi:hypothetical protein
MAPIVICGEEEVRPGLDESVSGLEVGTENEGVSVLAKPGEEPACHAEARRSVARPLFGTRKRDGERSDGLGRDRAE